MADQQHTEEGEHSPIRLPLQGDTERQRWLSVREHDEFSALAPDDSMAPAIRRGARIWFNSRLTPRDGDYVLIVDGQGEAFVREYRAKRTGSFRAVPTNVKFQSTFHAKRDQLVVLAVVTGHSYGSRSVQ